jgi:hypothetical protein
VIHETSDLAKKMYIQDGNLSVVQSISHIPDYEPSRREERYITPWKVVVYFRRKCWDYNNGLDPVLERSIHLVNVTNYNALIPAQIHLTMHQVLYRGPHKILK